MSIIRSQCFCAVVTLLGFAVSVAGARLDAQSTGACYDSASTRAQGYRHGYGVMVSLRDTASARERANLRLPLLAENQVRIVGDTAVCRAASLAYDAVSGLSYPRKPVIVLELGSNRVVIKDIGMRGPGLNILFNQDFTLMLQRIGF